MMDFRFEIGNPWYLLLLIPALIFGIIPFFRLHKKRRKASKHIIPFIIHMVLVFFLSITLAEMRLVQTVTTPKNTSVVFVVDVSESNQKTVDQMNTFIAQVMTEKANATGDVNFGLVTFGKEVFEDDVIPIGKLDINTAGGAYVKKYEPSDETSESNIHSALKYAAEMFPETELFADEDDLRNKRVILLSDGRETITKGGNAYNATQDLLENNIAVDAAIFDMLANKDAEVQLTELSTNVFVEYGKPAAINGVIKSTVNSNVTIKIYDNGKLVVEEKINVKRGDNPIHYEYDPYDENLFGKDAENAAGLHTITATIDVYGDNIDQNNMCCSWYSVEDIQRILILYGNGQKNQLEKFINRNFADSDEYAVETLDVASTEYTLKEKFPKTMEELLVYDEVVLLNIDFADLPENAPDLLKRYVSENGRGLVVSFGDTVYDATTNTYNESPIAEMLPVELAVKNEKQSVAFIFIVDLSSSMREAMGSETRYDVALASIKHALDALDVEKDYVGVIMFDETMQVAVDMQPLIDEENKQDIKDLIDYEFEHYYYEHFIDENGNETDIRVKANAGRNGTGIHPDQAHYLLPVEEGGYGYTVSSSIRWGTAHYTTYDVIKSHGTKYLPPITEADKMFAGARDEDGYRLDIKQVVFISDGEPSDKAEKEGEISPYIGIVETMADAGIVTSAIGIGSSINAAAEKEIRSIAEAGYTEPKFIKSADEVSGSLFDIVKSVEGKDLNSVDPSVEPDGYKQLKSRDESAPVLAGVKSFDKIWGYYGTTLKKEDPDNDLYPVMALYADDQRPILAEWKYGQGKVTVFTSNLGTYWTQTLYDDGDGIYNTRLLYNMLINSLNENPDSTGINIYKKPERNWGTGEANVFVELPNTKRSNEVLKAIVIDADGKETEFTFTSVGSKKYVAKITGLDESENGTYIIKVVLADASGQQDVVYDMATTAIVGEYKLEYDVFSDAGTVVINDIVRNQGKAPITPGEENALLGFYDIKNPNETTENYFNLDDEIAISALILFVVSIICRNFLFQKEKQRKMMTDEEQIASMRGSGR